MTRHKRITFPEVLVLALLAVLAAYLLQRYAGEEAGGFGETAERIAQTETSTAQEPPPSIAWDEDTLIAELCRGIEDEEAAITFPYDCTGSLFDAFHRVLADHPEYFWLTGSGSYTKKISETGTTVVFTPDTLIPREEIDRRRAALQERVDEILARAEAYPTDYERLLFLHDLLVDDTDYDTETADGMTGAVTSDAVSQATGVFGCLVNRRAVCSGYAAAYQLLLARLGIPCRRVQGTETQTGEAHEWNIVCLAGDWVHVDVTWDDPVFTGDMNGADGWRSYDYFCVTTDEIARTHIFEQDSIPPCVTDAYGYYQVNGLTLGEYAYDTASALISRQVGADCIRLKFPDEDALVPAVTDLIERRKIFDIPAVKSSGARSLRYSASDMGSLTVWLLP